MRSSGESMPGSASKVGISMRPVGGCGPLGSQTPCDAPDGMCASGSLISAEHGSTGFSARKGTSEEQGSSGPRCSPPIYAKPTSSSPMSEVRTSPDRISRVPGSTVRNRTNRRSGPTVSGRPERTPRKPGIASFKRVTDPISCVVEAWTGPRSPDRIRHPAFGFTPVSSRRLHVLRRDGDMS